jgi:hypothetical protein
MHEPLDMCPSCSEPIRWTPWCRYPPAWTGAPSRGDVRKGTCECGGKQHFASRLPQELFSRAAVMRADPPRISRNTGA